MMCLSQTTGYAIHALVCLENGTCKPRLIREIAACTGVPKPYLAKIMNQLVHKGLVAAKRGYHGGICLTRPAELISILDIVEAVEGPKWLGNCLLGLEHGSAELVCPNREDWLRIRNEIVHLLRRTSLADMIGQTHSAKSQSTHKAVTVPMARCCKSDARPLPPSQPSPPSPAPLPRRPLGEPARAY